MKYMAGTEFKIRKSISHYVNDRTNGWNQNLIGIQRDYWKYSVQILYGTTRDSVPSFGWMQNISNNEYLARHNRAFMVMAVAWAKEQNLLDQNVKWYQEKWKRGYILENSQAKLLWNFEFNLESTTTSKRSDLMLEDKQTKIMRVWKIITKIIIICNMTCPQEDKIEEKRLEREPITGSLPLK